MPDTEEQLTALVDEVKRADDAATLIRIRRDLVDLRVRVAQLPNSVTRDQLLRRCDEALIEFKYSLRRVVPPTGEPPAIAV